MIHKNSFGKGKIEHILIFAQFIGVGSVSKDTQIRRLISMIVLLSTTSFI